MPHAPDGHGDRPTQSQRDSALTTREMIELAEHFLAELQTRVMVMEQAWESGNWTRLRANAQQLLKSATRYGHDDIGASAGELDEVLASQQAEMAAIGESFESLIQACHRTLQK